MRKSILKKGAAVVLSCSMAAAMLAGCGSSADETTADSTTTKAGGETTTAADTSKAEQSQSAETTTAAGTTASEKPYEGVTLKWALTDNGVGQETEKMVALIKEKTGINVEFSITPTSAAGEIDRVLVGLMAGDSIDIIGRVPLQLEEFYNAGVLEPLDEMAANVGYDMEAVYGGAALKFGDETYGLPTERDIWLTYYNKKIFDDAGMPYPTAEGWTWEKYIETAQKLTDPEKDIWGSFIGNDAVHSYMYATQSGFNGYNSDGTSNFDDSLYSDSLEWFFSLGNDLKIQPSSVEVASGTYPYNTFLVNGNVAMWVCGGWVAASLADQTKYPRDWQAGVLPMPYPEGSEPSSLSIDTNYAIPATSSNKEAAFEAIRCIAEYKYTLGHGRVPSKVLSEEEARTYIEETLVPMYEFDGITTEELMTGWFDSKRNYIPEKIMGTADTIINQILTEESLLYGQGAKSLEDTVASIKERADAAIEEVEAE